jgi:ribosome-binding ATPase YchF (GTP1/OBG family)
MQIDTERFVQEIKMSTIERLDVMEANINRVMELMVADLRREIENHHNSIAELQQNLTDRAKSVKELSDDEIERINARFVTTKKSLMELHNRMGLMLLKENHEHSDQSLLARFAVLEKEIRSLQDARTNQKGRNAVWAIVISTGINLGFVLLRLFIK